MNGHKTGPLWRGICSVCGRDCAVNEDGRTIRAHGPRSRPCRGSLQPAVRTLPKENEMSGCDVMVPEGDGYGPPHHMCGQPATLVAKDRGGRVVYRFCFAHQYLARRDTFQGYRIEELHA